jgi:hypothetical protein
MTTNPIRRIYPDERTDGAPESALLKLYPSAVSPHADVVERQSLAWARLHGLCASSRELERLERARIGRLVARAFPHASCEGLQVAADWTTLFCLLDDRIEATAVRIAELAEYVAQLAGAFRGGRSGDDPATRAFTDLRLRILRLGDSTILTRFADALDRLYAANLWEHLNRQNGLYPSLSAFSKMRAITIGLEPQLVLAAVTDGISLSQAQLDEPGLRALTQHACNIVGTTNDLFTWQREQALGEVHNLVILLMHECGMSLEEARCATVQQHNDELRAFVARERQLPDAGDGELMRQRFIGVLHSCIRGHLDWAHETGRYNIPPDPSAT